MSPTATPETGRHPREAAPAHAASTGTLLVLLTGIFITTLDFFIVNVAIPDIQGDLRAGAAATQWVVAGFGLALGGGLITGGRLGDLFGRRRMYSLGLAVFTAASLACGLAPTPGTLIIARVAQGLAAALLMPQVLGIINGVFTGERRARAFTAYGLALGLGGVFGQLIGGALIQADLFGTGWRSIFLINVPVGIATLALIRRTVPPQPAEGTSETTADRQRPTPDGQRMVPPNPAKDASEETAGQQRPRPDGHRTIPHQATKDARQTMFGRRHPESDSHRTDTSQPTQRATGETARHRHPRSDGRRTVPTQATKDTTDETARHRHERSDSHRTVPPQATKDAEGRMFGRQRPESDGRRKVPAQAPEGVTEEKAHRNRLGFEGRRTVSAQVTQGATEETVGQGHPRSDGRGTVAFQATQGVTGETAGQRYPGSGGRRAVPRRPGEGAIGEMGGRGRLGHGVRGGWSSAPKGAVGGRLDVGGTALVTLGLIALVLPLIEGRRLGWPAWTWVSLAASVVLLAGFVLYQRRLARRGGVPLVAPALFREPAFRVGSGLALAYMLAMASFFLYLALYLQQGRGLSALQSGLLFVTLGAGYFAASTCAAAVAARLGRQVLALGAATQATGCLLLIVTVGQGVGWLIPGLAMAGAGMGLVLAPLSAIVLSRVTDGHAASAAGVLSTAQQVGNALGVAVVGIVFYEVLGDRPLPADVADAFRASLFPVIGFCLVTAGLAQLLPKR